LSWINWDDFARHGELFRFVKLLLHFRKRHSVLWRRWYTPEAHDLAPKLTWHGVRVGQPDWSNTSHSPERRRTLTYFSLLMPTGNATLSPYRRRPFASSGIDWSIPSSPHPLILPSGVRSRSWPVHSPTPLVLVAWSSWWVNRPMGLEAIRAEPTQSGEAHGTTVGPSQARASAISMCGAIRTQNTPVLGLFFLTPNPRTGPGIP
jgi:hypothetical protein